MESQQQANNEGKNFAVCRQSSTRWTPTTDQIRILKELYYNSGVRSPTAEQIQKISAKLRHYGKIEGKNVFYWFQNHKARERQKKRFTAPPPPPNIIPMHHNPSPIYNINPPGNFAPSSSAGYVSVGNYGYGSVETSFRDCSINPNGGQNYAWIGVDPYSNFLDKRKYEYQTLDMEMEEEEEEEAAPEIETLPLFPMHGGDALKVDDFNAWHRRIDDAGARASLELTLNSYYPAAS